MPRAGPASSLAPCISLPSLARSLPVLHARALRSAAVQGEAVHAEEALHVPGLSGCPHCPQPLQLHRVSLADGVQGPVRVAPAVHAPQALAVRHGQHGTAWPGSHRCPDGKRRVAMG